MKRDCCSSLQDRRSFIRIGGAGLATLFVGGPFFGTKLQAAAGPGRRLVVLEMNGGNDGLNTVIPYGLGAYYDRRQRLAIPASNVLHLDSNWGFHPSLPRLKDRFLAGQAAIFRGVGHSSPDLSHFAMMDYWRSGHLEGGSQTGQTGWLGRLLDNLSDTPASLAGLSLSSSLGPALLGQNPRSASALSKETGVMYFPGGLDQSFMDALQTMANEDAGDSAALKVARQGIRDSLTLSGFLNQVRESSTSYPETETGRLLSFAASILATNDWIRIVHVPLPLDFDTHVNQAGTQANNLGEIDGALDAFLKELETLNLADQTLVVTTSEFGRRVEDNGGEGTDHGTSNSLFVVGKTVKGGYYGDAPSLSRLDDYGNLISTMSFLDLLATVTQGWLGVEAAKVVPGGQVQNIFK